MSPRRAGIADWTDPRLHDLEYLRKGAGATAHKLARRPSLLRLIGSLDPVDALDKLRSTLSSLLANRDFAALANAFAMDGSPHSLLKDRRATFASRHDKSPDTVRDWEDRAIGELLLLLLSQQELPDLPRPTYLIEELTISYLIRDRHFVQAIHQRDVLILAKEANHFRYGVDETVALEDVSGGHVSVDERTANGFIYRITFPRMMFYGERHSFGFTERRPPGVPSPHHEITIDWASQIFSMPARRFRVEVTFQGEMPRTIWRFQQLPPAVRPGKPTQANALSRDGRDRVQAEFEGLHGGFCSGIAWKWVM